MKSLKELFLMAAEMMKVDKRMLPCKVACFATGCLCGSYLPYLNVFFISVGLSKFQSGILTGLMFVLPIIASPIWGWIVDRTGRRVLVLLALTTGGSFLLSASPWIAKSIRPMRRFSCNVTSGTNFSRSIEKTLLSSAVNVSEGCTSSNMNSTDTLMTVLLVVILFTSIFNLSLPMFIETLVMNVVKSSSRGASFGAQRVFWTVGVIIGNSLAGIVADHYRNPDLSMYTGTFFIFLPSTLLLFPIGCFLIRQLNKHELKDIERSRGGNEEGIANDGSRFTQILRFVFAFDTLFFLATVFIIGSSLSLLTNTSYVHVTDTMKRSKTEMTWVITARAISDISIFPFTSKVIKKLGGPLHAMQVGIFASFLRFFIMSFDLSFEAFVGIQMISGFSFALPWSACMEYCHVVSPKSIKATTSAIVITTFRPVSNLVSNLVGLKVYMLFGGRRLYFAFSMICLLWFLIIVVYYESRRVVNYCRSNTGEVKAEETEQITDGDKCSAEVKSLL